MRFEFKLPDIGEGMVEGEIVKWHVKVGDELAEDALMLDVMTDKATVTISAPKAGKVLELHAKEGEMKRVGEVLIVLEVQGSPQQSSKPEPQVFLPRHDAPRVQGERLKEEKPAVTLEAVKLGQKVLATPATRRLAQELGVNLSFVPGSGPGGRVTAEDVRHWRGGARVDESIAVHVPVHAPTGSEERIPLRGLRRKIAEKMTLSKTKIPHFTYVEEADVTELVSLREAADLKAVSKGIRLTYLPFIVKALVHALQKYPFLNSILDEERQEIVLKREYNIGIAAASPEGLTVPVLKNADQKSILEIAQEINELGDKARGGKLSIEQLQGSTFTITSLGPLGGIFATPIINYPEVGILGIHRIEKRPVVRENQVVVRDMMYVSLSFDHRVIDGDVGANFTREIINRISHPGLLALD